MSPNGDKGNNSSVMSNRNMVGDEAHPLPQPGPHLELDRPPNGPVGASDDSAPDLRILGDKVILQPSGVVGPNPRHRSASRSRPAPRRRRGPVMRDENEHELLGSVARFRSNPLAFLREVSLYVTGTGWRGYDEIIGQPIFYPGFGENMKAMVLEHPMLQNTIQEMERLWAARLEETGWIIPRGQNPEYEAHRDWWRRRNIEGYYDRVKEDLDGMICKFESKSFIRSAYYLVTQLLCRAYHQGIHVSSEEVLNLRRIAEECQKQKRSIIFLPCHKSHVDYVAMQLICYRLGIGLPTVVAGDNLNFPAVGSFLQHAGAMWIRRTFDPDDRLYISTVQAYIDTLLQNGFNFECFIEGGRSRTGKLLAPKFGILSFVLDSIMSGRVEDAIICPVSTQYDKVIETEGYVTELLGVPKKKENLVDFVSGGSSVLSLRLGRVDVRFQAPWSLREFIDDQLAGMRKLPRSLNLSLQDPNDKEVRRRVLRNLGYRVLSDINAVSVIMPTALIGTVLLTSGDRGLSSYKLISRVQWLAGTIRAKGGRVASFGGAPIDDVVARGLEVLGKDLVGSVDSAFDRSFFAADRFQLSFYRNMTIHLFVSEAIVCTALYPRTKRISGFSVRSTKYEDLYEQVQFLSSLFRAEFIFSSDGLTSNLRQTLQGLFKDGILELEMASDGNSVETVTVSEPEKESELENYDFYCFLLWPFIDAAWLAAVSLMGLTPPPEVSSDTWVEVSKAQNMAQEFGKMMYSQSRLTFLEAVNKETLKNSYQRFQEEGMIDVTRPREPGQAAKLRLSPSWHCPRDPTNGRLERRGKLWDFIRKISLSRKESSHRRDYASVRRMIVSQIDEAGRRLFDEAQRTQKTTKLEEGETVERTPKHRRKMVDKGPKL